jgi:hypothetical protein
MQGRKLIRGYNEIAISLEMCYTRCTGMDCRSLVSFDQTIASPLEMKSFVQQEMIRRGVLWGGSHVVSFSHTDADIDHILRAYRQVLPMLKDAVENDTLRSQLRGEPVEPVFRKTSNFNTKPVRNSVA